jgi:hypothetical protein
MLSHFFPYAVLLAPQRGQKPVLRVPGGNPTKELADLPWAAEEPVRTRDYCIESGTFSRSTGKCEFTKSSKTGKRYYYVTLRHFWSPVRIPGEYCLSIRKPLFTQKQWPLFKTCFFFSLLSFEELNTRLISRNLSLAGHLLWRTHSTALICYCGRSNFIKRNQPTFRGITSRY